MDPFLLAHQIGPVLYDISTGMHPVSIRDQMLRGFLLVERALEARLIDSDRSLLVVGAGVAGVTAAMTAAEYGVPTILVERRRKPFTAQAAASTRFVCPTQYDCPVGHWHKSTFPWTAPPLPLSWQSDRAAIVAAAWTSKLNAMRSMTSSLQVSYQRQFHKKYNIVPGGKGGELIEAFFDPPFPNEPLRFGMVISSVGPGSERCTVKDYTGHSFWGIDKYEQPTLGLTPGTKATVFISGGGDGALQDFLRVTTKAKSAADIYKLLPYQLKCE